MTIRGVPALALLVQLEPNLRQTQNEITGTTERTRLCFVMNFSQAIRAPSSSPSGGRVRESCEVGWSKFERRWYGTHPGAGKGLTARPAELVGGREGRG
jgi:hypothetical protein